MICKKCGAEIADSAKFCEFCGASIQAEEAPADHPAAQAIMGQAVPQYTGPAVEEKVKKKNVPLGILGALVGALLGGASIVLVGMLGYIASICGLILAICTIKGYELLGGKPGIPGLIFCTLLILVTPFLAQCASWAIIIVQEFGDVTFGQALSILPLIMETDPGAFFKDLGMLYLFAILGAGSTIWSAFKNK